MWTNLTEARVRVWRSQIRNPAPAFLSGRLASSLEACNLWFCPASPILGPDTRHPKSQSPGPLPHTAFFPPTFTLSLQTARFFSPGTIAPSPRHPP